MQRAACAQEGAGGLPAFGGSERANASLGGPELWGVLNVTDDSFFDGGRYLDPRNAISQAERLLREGAIKIDIGGASSRPPGRTYGAGAPTLCAEEELSRIVPVLEVLVQRHVPVSVDTQSGVVAQRALELGAAVINDVSMGASGALLEAVARFPSSELVLMHRRGDGRCQGDDVRYANVVREVLSELEVAIARAESFGIARQRIWIDPGLGFSKTPSQSAELLRALERFVQTGQRVLVGASRKSFIAALTAAEEENSLPPEERLGGSLAVALRAADAHVHALRVHDVLPTRQAIALRSLITPMGEEGARG